jgi:hypothetical protein
MLSTKVYKCEILALPFVVLVPVIVCVGFFFFMVATLHIDYIEDMLVKMSRE